MLAKYGVLCHIMSDMYAPLRKQFGKLQAMAMVRPLTAHNGKIGFNWRAGKYEPVIVSQNQGRQFNTSAYKDFLQEASKYWSNHANPQYSQYAAQMSERFTMQPSMRQVVLPTAVTSADLRKPEDLAIKGMQMSPDDIILNRKLLESVLVQT